MTNTSTCPLQAWESSRAQECLLHFTFNVLFQGCFQPLFFVSFQRWQYGPQHSEFKLADSKCSFIKPLLGHLQKQFMDHPGVCLQQVEICYFVLVGYFLIPCVWGFCISLMEKESFRKNLKVEKSLQINDSAVPVRWITGKITKFCKNILMVSCKVLSLENMYSTTDCFHWTIADWSRFIRLIFFYADWLKNYTCLPCQRWCLETMS